MLYLDHEAMLHYYWLSHLSSVNSSCVVTTQEMFVVWIILCSYGLKHIIIAFRV